MYVLEILLKRRRVMNLFQKTWKTLSEKMVYPEIAEREPLQKLYFFGIIAYCAVYQSALAVEMSTSSAHYLARIHLGKFKFDQVTTDTVEKLFAGTAEAGSMSYAALLHRTIGDIVKKLATDDVAAGALDVNAAMEIIASSFEEGQFPAPETA